MVILLDTWARSPTPRQVAWHKWRQNWKQAPNGSRLRSSLRISRWLLGQQKYRIWSFFNRLVVDPNDLTTIFDEQGMALPGRLLERVYSKIADSYHPRCLDTRGVLFRTEPIDGNAVMRGFDDSQGWQNLFSRGLEVIPMAGDHLSMIREHHPKLALEMNEVLKRHRSELDNQTEGIASLDLSATAHNFSRGKKSLRRWL
jgi:thioesterase domain-containing protein